MVLDSNAIVKSNSAINQDLGKPIAAEEHTVAQDMRLNSSLEIFILVKQLLKTLRLRTGMTGMELAAPDKMLRLGKLEAVSPHSLTTG